MLRRIPHASHGSFNPYVISNKEAHIINGNIFVGKVTKYKATTICEQSQQGTNDRRHFMNYCFALHVNCSLILNHGTTQNHPKRPTTIHNDPQPQVTKAYYESLYGAEVRSKIIFTFLSKSCK